VLDEAYQDGWMHVVHVEYQLLLLGIEDIGKEHKWKNVMVATV
jgi:hypothetical protein